MSGLQAKWLESTPLLPQRKTTVLRRSVGEKTVFRLSGRCEERSDEAIPPIGRRERSLKPSRF